MATELCKNLIHLLAIGDGDMDQYAIINVFAPYTTTGFHQMTINIGRRFCPSPRWLSPDLGSDLCQVWAQTADEFKVGGCSSLQFGYNWSPFGFGLPEETLGGGQSLPTRFHEMMCGEKKPFYELCHFTDLDPTEQRLLGANNYGRVLGQIIMDRIAKPMASKAFNQAFSTPCVDSLGLCFATRLSIAEIFRLPNIFEHVIAACDMATEEALVEISETMTDMRTSEIYRILQKTEHGLRNPAASIETQAQCLNDDDIAYLRRTPKLAGKRDTVAESLRNKGYPNELMDALWPPVVGRCSMKPNEQKHDGMPNWWRKGFSYSLSLTEDEDGSGQLRIAPFVYIGTCGMVEATQTLLVRRDTVPPCK